VKAHVLNRRERQASGTIEERLARISERENG
jgi:hypothetical protein